MKENRREGGGPYLYSEYSLRVHGVSGVRTYERSECLSSCSSQRSTPYDGLKLKERKKRVIGGSSDVDGGEDGLRVKRVEGGVLGEWATIS